MLLAQVSLVQSSRQHPLVGQDKDPLATGEGCLWPQGLALSLLCPPASPMMGLVASSLTHPECAFVLMSPTACLPGGQEDLWPRVWQLLSTAISPFCSQSPSPHPRTCLCCREAVLSKGEGRSSATRASSPPSPRADAPHTWQESAGCI